MDNHRSTDPRSTTTLARPDPFGLNSQALMRRNSPGYGYGMASYGYTAPRVNSSQEDGEASGLLQYWHVLRRHKGTWILCAFLGAVVGFFVTLPQTPVYQARTSIEIQGFNDNFLNMRQSSQVYDSGGSDGSEIPTQLKILQSESLTEQVIAQLKAAGTPVVDHSRLSAWRRLFNLKGSDPEAIRNQQLGQLVSTVKARSAGQTRVIEITADCSDAGLAAAFVSAMANNFIEQNREARWKATEKTAEWLGHQLDDMRIKLEHSEDSLQQYARNSGLLFTDEKTNVSEEKLKELQTELFAATAARITRQSTYELAQKSSPDALPDVLADAGLRETAAKMRDLRSQIADLSAIYTPDYAKVKRAQAELSALQSTFDRDRTSIIGRIKNEYQQAARREELLQTAYSAQTRQVTGEGEKSIQYNILKREVDSNRQLYDAMLAQLKQSSIASAMRASNVRIVDPAKVPPAPYKPDLKQGAALGSAAGIFLGAAFIILRSRADRTIQQPGESTIYLDLPELGIIPAGKNEKLRALASEAGTSSPNDRVELETWQRKPSVVAESFRAALISILFTGESGLDARPQTLVLTSPGPAEGKSTVTSNLAIAIAEVGRRVLLIDADMRRPRQHEVFAVENDLGLSTLLREKTPLGSDLSLDGMIQETRIPGLWLLPSGPGTSSATNLLYSSHMSALLAYLRERFDTILIDTPPMLHIPDARVIARLADSVVMVLRANQTTRDAVMAACQRFREDGTRVLGTILNDWNPQTSPNGYYGYDKTYNNYGYSQPNGK